MAVENHSAHNLRVIRKKYDLRQQDLADLIGCTRANIGSYEEGRAKMPVELIIKVCRKYDIRMEDFVFKKLEIDAALRI